MHILYTRWNLGAFEETDNPHFFSYHLFESLFCVNHVVLATVLSSPRADFCQLRHCQSSHASVFTIHASVVSFFSI